MDLPTNIEGFYNVNLPFLYQNENGPPVVSVEVFGGGFLWAISNEHPPQKQWLIGGGGIKTKIICIKKK